MSAFLYDVVAALRRQFVDYSPSPTVLEQSVRPPMEDGELRRTPMPGRVSVDDWNPHRSGLLEKVADGRNYAPVSSFAEVLPSRMQELVLRVHDEYQSSTRIQSTLSWTGADQPRESVGVDDYFTLLQNQFSLPHATEESRFSGGADRCNSHPYYLAGSRRMDPRLLMFRGSRNETCLARTSFADRFTRWPVAMAFRPSPVLLVPCLCSLCSPW